MKYVRDNHIVHMCNIDYIFFYIMAVIYVIVNFFNFRRIVVRWHNTC